MPGGRHGGASSTAIQPYRTYARASGTVVADGCVRQRHAARIDAWISAAGVSGYGWPAQVNLTDGTGLLGAGQLDAERAAAISTGHFGQSPDRLAPL